MAIVKPLGAVYREHHPYPDDIFWSIEFSDTALDKDLTEKRAIYAEVAIAEYWVVNLKDREPVVFRNPDDGNCAIEVIYRIGIVSPLAFGDIQISVERLFDPESK